MTTAIKGNDTSTFGGAIAANNVSAIVPAFSAYLSSTQDFTNGVYTKIAYNVEEFDTNSNYDNATNYRFTPTVAGYYQVHTSVYLDAVTANLAGAFLLFYKNGVNSKLTTPYVTGTANRWSGNLSALFYMNGTTDYIESYFRQASGATQTLLGNATGTTVFFQGFLARAA